MFTKRLKMVKISHISVGVFRLNDFTQIASARFFMDNYLTSAPLSDAQSIGDKTYILKTKLCCLSTISSSVLLFSLHALIVP